MTEKIIHKELSYHVNGCIFGVHNEVGPGLREECYQKAMEHALVHAGIPFASKPRTRSELVYKGLVVDVFEPDLLIHDRIVVELKHQPEGLVRDNFTQVLNYLKFLDLRLGLPDYAATYQQPHLRPDGSHLRRDSRPSHPYHADASTANRLRHWHHRLFRKVQAHDSRRQEIVKKSVSNE